MVAKNHILQCASRLFFAEGLTTGIDRVTNECDIRHRVTEPADRAGKRLLDVPGDRFQALVTSLPASQPPLAVPPRERDWVAPPLGENPQPAAQRQCSRKPTHLYHVKSDFHCIVPA